MRHDDKKSIVNTLFLIFSAAYEDSENNLSHQLIQRSLDTLLYPFRDHPNFADIQESLIEKVDEHIDKIQKSKETRAQFGNFASSLQNPWYRFMVIVFIIIIGVAISLPFMLSHRSQADKDSISREDRVLGQFPSVVSRLTEADIGFVSSEIDPNVFSLEEVQSLWQASEDITELPRDTILIGEENISFDDNDVFLYKMLPDSRNIHSQAMVQDVLQIGDNQLDRLDIHDDSYVYSFDYKQHHFSIDRIVPPSEYVSDNQTEIEVFPLLGDKSLTEQKILQSADSFLVQRGLSTRNFTGPFIDGINELDAIEDFSQADDLSMINLYYTLNVDGNQVFDIVNGDWLRALDMKLYSNTYEIDSVSAWFDAMYFEKSRYIRDASHTDNNYFVSSALVSSLPQSLQVQSSQAGFLPLTLKNHHKYFVPILVLETVDSGDVDSEDIYHVILPLID